MSDLLADLAEVTGLSIDEVRRLNAKGGLQLTDDQSRAFDERVAKREWVAFEQAAESEYSSALLRLSSSQRAQGIVYLSEAHGFSDEQLRDVLREYWTICDGPGDVTDALLDLFRRASYVSDTDCTLEGELTIYRGTFGDDPRGGLSWTLDRKHAEWFAQRGARGVPRDRSEQTVWRATVDASSILGYFTGRGEAEVIVAPKTLRDVTQAPADDRTVPTPVPTSDQKKAD
jgi:hypothetical protein